jgi:hypothetical protein
MLIRAGKKDEEGEAVVSLKQWDLLGDNKSLCIGHGMTTVILSFIHMCKKNLDVRERKEQKTTA